MKKLRIIEVGNNIKGSHDGIGKHAGIMAKALSFNPDTEFVCLAGASTFGKTKAGLILSLKMTNVFRLLPMLIKKYSIDCVVIEYPFMEYNPLILPALYWLKQKCRKLKCSLCSSIHEYDRVNPIRRLVIKEFAKHSDFLFVSEEKSLQQLKKFQSNIYIRTIPNHIPVIRTSKIKNRTQFVYFGLVSRAKAFYEMIDAWNIFNRNEKYELIVLTSSDIQPGSSWNGVTVKKGLCDKEIARIMCHASYCIIPVIPKIGLNNSSFISALQCRCIPAGIFDNSLKDFDFLVNLSSYDIESFCSAFQKLINMDNETFEFMKEQAFQFGAKYTAEETAKQMIDVIKKEVSYDNRN